jgi:zinc protease
VNSSKFSFSNSRAAPCRCTESSGIPFRSLRRCGVAGDAAEVSLWTLFRDQRIGSDRPVYVILSEKAHAPRSALFPRVVIRSENFLHRGNTIGLASNKKRGFGMRILRIIVTLGVVITILLKAAPAVQARRDPPAYQSAVREETLPNGLRVLLLEDHKAPVVSFQVWYRVGSRNEVAGKTGLAHLLEHMMFKGTPRFGPKTFSQTISRNGGDDNAFTMTDQTVYFENITSDRLEVAVRLEADRMTHLLLDPGEFLSERDVVLEERRLRTEDGPSRELGEQLDAAAYTAHPYMNPVIGWMDDIRNLTRDDAVDFYKRHYRPSNATIIAVGDFDGDFLLGLIRKHFGPLAKLPRPEEPTLSEPKQKGKRRVTLRRPAELPLVYKSYHAPRLGHPDFPALEVLEAILSNGRSARLLQSLVFETNLATSASAGYDGLSIDPRVFRIYAQVFPGRKIEEVEAAIEREIHKLREEKIPEREIRKAKTRIEADWYRAQDSMFYRGMLLGQFAMAGDWREIDEHLPAIRKVRARDVREAARRLFSEENETTAVLIPAKAATRGGGPASHGGTP